MSYTVVPVATATPGPVERRSLEQTVRVGLAVEVPEPAHRFADLVVRAYDYRVKDRQRVATVQPSLLELLRQGAPHAVPIAAGVLVGVLTGIGEGVAGALALWGAVRCALPARPSSSHVSRVRAEEIRDSAINAALADDPTSLATMRYAAIAALEEANIYCGHEAGAELVTQALLFAPPVEGACDDTARRAAQAVEALLYRIPSLPRPSTTLDHLNAHEVMALAARSRHFARDGGGGELDRVVRRAQDQLDAAATAAVQAMIAVRAR